MKQGYLMLWPDTFRFSGDWHLWKVNGDEPVITEL
jgi:hypothetical protein